MKAIIHPSLLIYGVLAILIFQPIADFTAFNYYQASFSLMRCMAYFLVLLGFSALAIWVAKKCFGKKNQMVFALAFGMNIMWIFNNYAVEAFLQQVLQEGYRFRFLILADIFAFILIFVFAFILNKFKPFRYAFLGTIFLTAILNLSMMKQQETHYQEFDIQEYPISKSRVNEPKLKPNIYYIIPDGFMGVTMFNKISQSKLTVENQLEDRGFQVIHDAYSNGSATLLSIPQTYTMQYLFKEGEIIKGKKLRELGDLYQKESPVTRAFKQRGYKFYRFADGMTSHCHGTEDKCIQKSSLFTIQDTVFMNRTLLPSALAHKLWWSKGLIPGQMEMNDFVNLLPDSKEGPFFLIGHFSLPHSPFRFDANCNSLGYSSVFSSTAAYFEKKPGKERFEIYSGQAFCAQNLLLQLVDGILHKDPNAIIIIQADHGNQDYFDAYHRQVETLTFDEFSQSFNILYAFYAPDALKKQLYDGFSPINTFRLVLAWLDDTEPDLLPHRSFYGILNKKLLEDVQGTYVMHEWYDAPVPNKMNRV